MAASPTTTAGWLSPPTRGAASTRPRLLLLTRDTDKPENECAELAMRDALDAYGEFQTKIDGTLEYKDFLVFRAIIMRQSSRHFKPKRDELNEKKLEAFANKDQ